MTKQADWWRRQGYENEPGVKAVPAGRSAEARLLRDRFVNGSNPDDGPDDTYSPTQSSNPDDPRTATMYYYATQEVVRVEWGDSGAPYLYFKINQQTWDDWKASESPGRYINNQLRSHRYSVA